MVVDPSLILYIMVHNSYFEKKCLIKLDEDSRKRLIEWSLE